MPSTRRNRFPTWLIALLFIASVSACATEIDFEDEYSEDVGVDDATEEELAEMQSIADTEAALLGGCSFDAQCGFGKVCDGGTCKSKTVCFRDKDCPLGKSCKGGYCQGTKHTPNNPCDVDAARAFGQKVCRELCSWNSNLWSQCLQAMYAAHSCTSANNVPNFPDCTRPSDPSPPPAPQCTRRNDVCSTTSDCCSGLTCRADFSTFKTCK